MVFIFWKHLYLWWYRSLVLIFCMSDIFREVLTYGGRETCGTSALIPRGCGNLLSFKTVNLVYSWSEWWKNVSRKWLSPNMRGKTYGFFSDMSLKVSMLHIAEAKLNTGYCHNSEGDEQCKGGRHEGTEGTQRDTRCVCMARLYDKSELTGYVVSPIHW